MSEPVQDRTFRGAFVGRAEELALLVSALALAQGGRGSLCVLSGEAGIGKTRLAEEISEHAAQAGAVVAWGSAWDGGGAPAHWPWIQIVRALEPLLGAPGEALLRDLGPLSGSSFEGRDVVDPRDEDAEVRQFRRYDALRALLATAAERTPLCLVLDDLHAADRGTLTALKFIAKSLRALRILLIATQRDAEARQRPEVRDLLDRLARDGRTLALRRLERGEVLELTRDLEPVAPAQIDRIFAVSGGNPFFAKEVLRLVQSGAATERIPEGARVLVGERLAGLGSEPLRALEAMAVVGREAATAVLVRVCGCSPHELVERLRGPVLSGVIEQATTDRFVFAHPLFRECLYEAVDPGRRALLHLATAEALAWLGSALPGQLESVARHLLLALPAGDLDHAIAQARVAARGCVHEASFDRARELLERALAALGSSTDDALRSDLELDLAEVLTLVGEGEQSRRICASVAERARANDDADRLARAALVHGLEIRVAVVDRQLITLLEAALGALGAGDSTLRAKLLARLAAARQPNPPDPQSPVAQAFEAIALARATGDPETLLHALHTGGAALTSYAPPAKRREVSRELAWLATSRHDLVRAQRGYARWAVDAAELGDVDELRHAISAERHLGQTLGQARYRWQSSLLASMHALIEGRFADSERAVEEAERLVAESEDPRAARVLAVHRLGALRAKMQPTTGPHRAEPDGGNENHVTLLVGQLAVSSYLARLGEATKAETAFAKLVPLPEYLPIIPAALVTAAEAALRVGHAESVRALLPALESLPFPAVSWGATAFLWEGFTIDLVGRAQVLLGNLDDGIRTLESALEAAELFGARPAALETELALASALLERRLEGDDERAEELVASAEAAAGELGMTGAVRRSGLLRERCAARAGAPVVGVPSRAGAPREQVFSLLREGEIWSATSGERTVRLKHSRALEILKELVDHPDREFHVLDLSAKSDGDAPIDRGDAGELIDGAAADAYRKRALALRAELDEAERWNDPARRERAQAELAFLEAELSRGVGLGGKLRRGPDATERARVNVHKRLKGAIRRLSAELPEVARHLEASISTGIFVAYRPPH